MPAAQVIGTKPLTDQEEPKVNDGDFELISKIRCFAGIGYVSFSLKKGIKTFVDR